MHRFPTEQIVLLILQASILVALVIRVWATGLFRRYPCFFGYLLMALLPTLVSPFIPFDQVIYRYFWVVTQALLTFFCALIVLELYGLVLRDLTGFACAFRRYFKICLGIAILGSLLLLRIEKTPHGVVSTFLTIDQALVTSLLIFVILLTAFLAYYPVPINRNLVVYSMGYAVYFMAKASGLLTMNVTQAWARQVAVVVAAASTISTLFWLLALNSQGEEKTLIIGHRWNREDQEKVLQQIKAINASLIGSGRE